MFARQQVTAEHWVRIIALIGEGIGVRAIPRRLQTSRLVFVWLCDWFFATGSSLRRPHTGPSRATTRQQDHHLCLGALGERTSTSSTLRSHLWTSFSPRCKQTGFGNVTKFYGLLLCWRSLPLSKAPSSKTTMRMRIGPNSSPTSKGNRWDVLGSVLARLNPIKHLWDDLGSNHAPPATLARLVQVLQMGGTPFLRRVSGTLSSRYVADVKLASKLGVDTPGFKDISNWIWHSQIFENGGTPLYAHVTLRIRAQMKFDYQKRFGERLHKMLHNPHLVSFVYVLIDRGWCKWSLTFDAEYICVILYPSKKFNSQTYSFGHE